MPDDSGVFFIIAMNQREWYAARSAADAIAAMGADHAGATAGELRDAGLLGPEGTYPRRLTDAEMGGLTAVYEGEAGDVRRTFREELALLDPGTAQVFLPANE